MKIDKMKVLEIINKAILYIGIAMIIIGLSVQYQAKHDVKVLNESLYKIATSNNILTDGTTYYYIGLYENKYNFSSLELLNRTQCNDLYGD